MIRQAGALGAIALGIVLASTSADAQAAHHRAKHPAVAGAAGRQIIVRQGVEPWLTMGTWAPVGSRNGYALDTLTSPMQRNTVQGTFVGMRGNDRLPNAVRLPEANRPLITVSSPGLSGPWFDWY